MTHIYTPPEVTRKLSEISEVMADGYHFVHMRMLVEDWETKALAGDKMAQDMMAVIDTFHRLCTVVKEKK